MTQNSNYTLGEIAELLDLALDGDPHCLISGLATLQSARSGQLSFLSNPSYVAQLSHCQASAVIVSPQQASGFSGNKLLSESPYVSFAHATAIFASTEENLPAAIHPSAEISPTASIADNVSIGPNTVIGDNCTIGTNSRIGPGCFLGRNCSLGRDCTVYANVICYGKTCIGDEVIVHANTVLGADGFGFAFDGEKSVKIHQLGGVQIGDHVEIGAGTTIDRGALEDTVIERGVKIDNQVQIGHNCRIGEHTVICGCTAIAGSATIGKYCIMGGASGVVGHITIADKVQVSAMSLVSQPITEPGMYSSGTGQMKTAQWKRATVRFAQLDDIAKRLKKIEQHNK